MDFTQAAVDLLRLFDDIDKNTRQHGKEWVNMQRQHAVIHALRNAYERGQEIETEN